MNAPAFCNKAINSRSMNPYPSGMSRQTILFPFKYRPNFFISFALCLRSITNSTSAYFICSSSNGVTASSAKPAESVSTPGHDENTCSAVGLLRRFLLHRNSARIDYLLTTIKQRLTVSAMFNRATRQPQRQSE